MTPSHNGLSATVRRRGAGFDGAERAAVEELFTAFHPRLTCWVRQLVHDDEIARDVAAEAFARVLGRWSELDNPRRYLYVIAANLVKDHWRKSRREQRAVSKMAAAYAGASTWYPADGADLGALIEALPHRLRSAFLLHYCLGCKVREVADLLDKPEGAIKSDLHRARSLLRAELADTAA